MPLKCEYKYCCSHLRVFRSYPETCSRWKIWIALSLSPHIQPICKPPSFLRVISLTEPLQLTHPSKIHLQGSSSQLWISHLNIALQTCSAKIHQTHCWKMAFWTCHLLQLSPPWFFPSRCITSQSLGFFFPNVILSIPITNFSAKRSTPAYTLAWDQPMLNRHLWVFSPSGEGSHPWEQTWDLWNSF